MYRRGDLPPFGAAFLFCSCKSWFSRESGWNTDRFCCGQVPKSGAFWPGGLISELFKKIQHAIQVIIDSEQALAPETIFDAAGIGWFVALYFMAEAFQIVLQRFQFIDARFVQVNGIEIADIYFG